jgi:hypothetical protein
LVVVRKRLGRYKTRVRRWIGLMGDIGGRGRSRITELGIVTTAGESLLGVSSGGIHLFISAFILFEGQAIESGSWLNSRRGRKEEGQENGEVVKVSSIQGI